jgi:hypothetical protein
VQASAWTSVGNAALLAAAATATTFAAAAAAASDSAAAARGVNKRRRPRFAARTAADRGKGSQKAAPGLRRVVGRSVGRSVGRAVGRAPFFSGLTQKTATLESMSGRRRFCFREAISCMCCRLLP